MTEQEINNKNKLIAEFMGYSMCDDGFHWAKISNGEIESLMQRDDIIGYSESWDWLMPVVKKCHEQIKEMGFDRRGAYHPIHGYVSKIYNMSINSPIEDVWQEVVNHINRYKK